MVRTNFIKWILDLITINVVGLILITIYSACYNFETMLFGVHTAAAVKDFWNTEILMDIVFLICVNTFTVITVVARQFKK